MVLNRYLRVSDSTGVQLTEADKIRNYVIMEQEPHLQDRLYVNYWYPMEESFGKPV